MQYVRRLDARAHLWLYIAAWPKFPLAMAWCCLRLASPACHCSQPSSSSEFDQPGRLGRSWRRSKQPPHPPSCTPCRPVVPRVLRRPPWAACRRRDQGDAPHAVCYINGQGLIQRDFKAGNLRDRSVELAASASQSIHQPSLTHLHP